MRKTETTTISFRATEQLRKKLIDFCMENEQCNSGVIRQAIVTFLQRQSSPEATGSLKSNLTSSNS
jgi:hypothetical protein